MTRRWNRILCVSVLAGLSTALSAMAATGVRIATWHGDAKGVFSLMFDDGAPSHWQVVVPELVDRDMPATFYICPAKTEYTSYRGAWENGVWTNGMVYGDHTMTHLQLADFADADWEIGQCAQEILEHTPGSNPRLISWGRPGLGTGMWNITEEELTTLLTRYHLIDRPPYAGHGAVYHLQTAAQVLSLADQAITNGGMEYVIAHGVERRLPLNMGYQDFQAWNLDVFRSVLEGLKQRRDAGDLWITDPISYHKYMVERTNATVQVLHADDVRVDVSVTCSVDRAFYDGPLTLVVDVPTNWPHCRVGQGTGSTFSAVVNGQVQFDASPGSSLSLSPVSAPATIQSLVISTNPVTVSSSALLVVRASDPEGDPLSVAWSKLSGPGDVTFVPGNAATSTVSFSSTGPYELQVAVADGTTVTRTSVVVQVEGEWAGPVVTWTGGGSGSNWNEEANWDLRVPGPGDTAKFTSEGISLGRVICLGASQSVSNLVIATKTDFTIGSVSDVAASNTLTVSRVDRLDVSGIEGNHTLAMDMVMGSNSLWTVRGGGCLIVSRSLSGAGSGIGLVKRGATQLRVMANSFAGNTVVSEGELVGTNGAVKGSLVVGSPVTSVPAYFGPMDDNCNDVVANGKTVTVYTNGAYTTGNSGENIGNLNVYGGTATLKSAYVYGTITMAGGRISGGGNINGNIYNILCVNSDRAAIIDIRPQIYAYGNSTIAVSNNPVPIDVRFSSGLGSGSSSYTLTKSGAGVMQIGAGSAVADKTFIIGAGTMLADNPSGSATGSGAVQVNGGATLGGMGFIGGVAGYTGANVRVSGSSVSNRATMAPGSMDTNTGAHLPGTLTVGGAAQTNSVTLANFSRLLIHIGGGVNDRLVVYGGLDLTSGSDRLDIELSGLRGGTYTVASASGGVSGVFDEVTGLPAGAVISYSPTEVKVIIPRQGTHLMVR